MTAYLDYEQTLVDFPQLLEVNRLKAQQKKEEYLGRILQIFEDFASKCEAEIAGIIDRKLERMQDNYESVVEYLEGELTQEQRSLVIAEFLVKPFQRFPFSGEKNEKIFKEQYNLIEKASFLIQQTLLDSFNEDHLPNFQDPHFFHSLHSHGLATQSLLRLAIPAPTLHPLPDLHPLQKSVRSLKVMGEFVVLVGDEPTLEIWDVESGTCVQQLFMETMAEVTSLGMLQLDSLMCLAVGFGDATPQIWVYRTDTWARYGCSLAHTRAVTKIVQAAEWAVSGSVDGNLCLHSIWPLKQLQSSAHISSIEDLMVKGRLVYVLLKCSSLCEYSLQVEEGQAGLQFRRTLATGYISMMRYTPLAANFTAIACHIYGLSQIEISSKFRVEETSIINIPEMISDFVVLESKTTSDYFAVCAFQNSSAVRLYSLRSGEPVCEIPGDYLGEVGVAGYLPKVDITRVGTDYVVMVVNQSEFDAGNTVRLYRLDL